VREMRTIPTILAAAAILATSTVLSAPAPQAHADPDYGKCAQFSLIPDALNTCMQREQQIAGNDPNNLQFPRYNQEPEPAPITPVITPPPDPKPGSPVLRPGGPAYRPVG
jgi:hypothetical protein